MVRRPAFLAAPALAFFLCGCGLGDGASGVQAVASERSLVVDVIDVTLPEPSDLLSPIEPVDEVADEVETLVEPTMSRPSTVAVVGDSLTLSAEDEILVALEDGGLQVLAIDGVESRRMVRGSTNLPPGTDAVEQIRADAEPGIWVIALGTNDVASVESLVGFREEMREVLDLIPPDDPVIWVDLWIRGREEPVGRANRVIRSELRRRRGGSAVVDWYSHGDEDGIITGDGVHLTQSGQDLFAASIAAAIDELFGV